MKRKITLEIDGAGDVNLNKIKSIFVPNWFTKTHFEQMLGRKISDRKFQELKDYLSDSLQDTVSGEVRDALDYWQTVEEEHHIEEE